MKIRMRHLHLFILLFAVSSLLFQLPSEAFASTPSDITAKGSMTDDENTVLDAAHGVDTFTIGSSTYAIVLGEQENGVQIIDISDVDNIVAKGSMTDNDSRNLASPRNVSTFTIGSSTYAIVASLTENGVQIIDISDVDKIMAKGTATDGEGLFDELEGVHAVETFVIGSSTYAIVGSLTDDGVQIIDISDVDNIVAKGSMTDNGSRELDGVRDISTFVIGSSTYAIVTASSESGVQIIDISDVDNIVAKGNASSSDSGFDELQGAYGVDTFTIGSSTFAIVASSGLNGGVQMIDISDVDNIVAKDKKADEENSFTVLDGGSDVATFVIGSSTYAIVTASSESGVQMIDISDVDNIVAKGSMTDNGSRELDGANRVDIFTIDSITYAIVTAGTDDGVQIIELNTDTTSPTVTITSSSGDSGDSTSSTTLSYTATFSESVSNFVVGDITVTGTANDGSPAASNFAGSGTTYTFDVVQGSSDGTVSVSVAAGKATDAVGNDNTVSNTYTFTIDTSVEASDTSTASTGGTCSRHVILGNCGTIAINNDEYLIINTWTNVPTTEVLVGQPVTVTLSTPNNPTHTKIHFASVHTEVFSIPANFDQTAHIDYSPVNNQVTYVSQSQLFQVAGATHRIVQDPDVKNLEMFEVVFTMIFAKPMDTSHVVVETENKFGIPETLYLMDALKVNENLAQALTLEEKSKFSIVEPEMDPEPEIEMDPEPEQTKKEKSKRQRR